MVAAPLSQSDFSRGERSAIAKWAKAVEENTELLGKPSQSVGTKSSGSSKFKKLEEENANLKSEIAEMKEMLALLVAQKNEEDEG